MLKNDAISWHRSGLPCARCAIPKLGVAHAALSLKTNNSCLQSIAIALSLYL